MTKRRVVLLAILALAIVLLGVTRTWVTGTVRDAVLADSDVSVSGTSAAPAVLATALVGAAAIVAALTTGRIARFVAGVLAVLSGLVAIGATIIVLIDPAAAVRGRAAAITGHTGGVQVSAHLSFWPWVTLAGGVLLAVTGVLSLVGARRWAGLSAHYDAPGVARRRTVSDWDKLSQGEDPTEDDRSGLTE